MNECVIPLAGTRLRPLPSGALHWAAREALTVSDLHLGKADRIARRSGALLPPYETRDTLDRLAADLDRTGARTVICLGDSFDDLDAAAALDEADAMLLARLQAGRRWIWIEGNHDPGPADMGGTHLAEFTDGALTFRHIARDGARGEVSGHYHPKARLSARGQTISRPCFLYDANRVIMPAYGTYTGGLAWTAPELRRLMGPDALAALTGEPICRLPLPPTPEPA